jgi:hypothetical protein
MKRILVLSVIFSLIFSITALAQRGNTSSETTIKPADTTVTKAAKKSVDEVQKTENIKFNFKGTVVNFNKYVNNDKTPTTLEEAKKLAQAGQPFAFMMQKKVYFVYSSGGVFINDQLAALIESKEVGIVGRKKTIGGINIIFADIIRPIK